MAAAIKLWQGASGVLEFLPVFFLTPLWAELDDPTLKTAEAGVALGHCSCWYWLNCTFFFLIKGPVFAVQTRPWLFSEGGVGDVMLLQKVGSAYAKASMCFRIEREPSWLWSNITHFTNPVLSQFCFHELCGNTHTWIFCVWGGIMSWSAKRCDKMQHFYG